MGVFDDVRFIGSLLGRYTLESRARTSGVQIFACRLQSISPRMLVASAPVVGEQQEKFTAHFGPFGTMRGQIARHIEGGFCVELTGDDAVRDRLAARIAWYKRRTFEGLPEKREHRRFIPREPRSTVLLPDGRLLPCLVMDLSVSGAAISADLEPAIGAPMAIGKTVSRVVRHLDVGFAVKFAEPLEIDVVEEMIRSPDDWQRAMDTRARAAELFGRPGPGLREPGEE